jgi:hypothetical protein
MTRLYVGIAAGLILVWPNTATRGQIVMPVGAPVDHPLVATNPVRTAVSWKKGVEGFGETLVNGTLRRRGYEFVNSKIAGNHGIDLIAIKRTSEGTIADLRLIEVKAHYGSGMPHLGQTRHGLQTSRAWFADRLWKLRSNGDEGKALALEISRFGKSKGIPIEQLGEVHDINLRTMKYTIRNPVTLAERAGPLSIPRQLNEIASRLPAERQWAIEHLAQADQIRQARMGTWLTSSPSARALDRVTATRILSIEEKQALRGMGRALAGAAGRIAFVAAVAVDAYEIYSHIRDYGYRIISRQEFVVALARSGGGIVGAWAGAAGGAVAGAWVGAFGGPCAWVTVPVCGVIGGAAGGIAGYLGGSYLGDVAAQAWYRSLDQKVKGRIDQWLRLTSTPFDAQR